MKGDRIGTIEGQCLSSRGGGKSCHMVVEVCPATSEIGSFMIVRESHRHRNTLTRGSSSNRGAQILDPLGTEMWSSSFTGEKGIIGGLLFTRDHSSTVFRDSPLLRGPDFPMRAHTCTHSMSHVSLGLIKKRWVQSPPREMSPLS